jgi:hypothetical protein
MFDFGSGKLQPDGFEGLFQKLALIVLHYLQSFFKEQNRGWAIYSRRREISGARKARRNTKG